MKYDIEQKLSNGNTIFYREYEGTFYEVGIKLKDGAIKDYDVSEGLIKILKNYEHKTWRLRLWYGDKKTGKAWNEEYDVMGTIGRSSGKIKIPLLLYSKRSYGGPALSVGSIIRVDDIEEHRTLWKVENFNISQMTLEYKDVGSLYTWHVNQNGAEVAGFRTEESAKRWIDFMNGKRYNK